MQLASGAARLLAPSMGTAMAAGGEGPSCATHSKDLLRRWPLSISSSQTGKQPCKG